MSAARPRPGVAVAMAVPFLPFLIAAAGDESDLPDWFQEPALAFLLLALGIASLMVELANPGIVGTGVLGTVAVLVGLWSLSTQSLNTTGLALLVASGVLFSIEVLTPSPGIAGAAGTAALLAGGIFLVDRTDGGVPPAVVIPTALVAGVAVVLAGRVAVRARQLPSTLTGPERLIGRDVTVRRIDETGTTGHAFVDGSWWDVRSSGPVLGAGTRARIVAVDGLVLIVDPAAVDGPSAPQPWRQA